MSTTDTYEKSNFFASPIELYRFDIGGQIHYFASRRKDFLASDGNTYLSENLKRSRTRRGTDFRKQDMTITCRGDFIVAERFKSALPGEKIDVTLMRTHSDASDMEFIWSGRVLGCTFKNSKAELDCRSHLSVLEEYTVRKSYQRHCNHAVYGEACGVLKANFSSTIAISNISSSRIVISSPNLNQPEGYFIGGLFEVDGISRMIVAHDAVNKTITISAPIDGLEEGQDVTVIRGCDRTYETCKNVFNNEFNYFGFFHVPKENPFTKKLG